MVNMTISAQAGGDQMTPACPKVGAKRQCGGDLPAYRENGRNVRHSVAFCSDACRKRYGRLWRAGVRDNRRL
jgi:hypothetical protein